LTGHLPFILKTGNRKWKGRFETVLKTILCRRLNRKNMNQKLLAAIVDGYACCIKADVENIASFIATYAQYTDISIVTLHMYPLLTTRIGYIDRCYDQDFIRELLPVLVPMQLGDKEPPEIVYPKTYGDFNEKTAPIPDWSCSEGHGLFNEAIPKPCYDWNPEDLEIILEANDSFQNRFNQNSNMKFEPETENEDFER